MIRPGSHSGRCLKRPASFFRGTSRYLSGSQATAWRASSPASSRTPNSLWRISSNRSSTCSPGASSNATRNCAWSWPRPAPAGCPGSSRSSTTAIGGCGRQRKFWADKGGIALETRPSELFKRQIYATFQEDEAAMSLIPFFGDGHLLWASDYPHPDSVWPNSRAAIERQMKHLSPEMRQKLTRDNAAKLYGLV